MIKVCHISTSHPTFDGRIFHKECVSLAEAGYDVSLVVTHTKKETVKGVKIVPLGPSKGRLHRIFVKTAYAFKKALGTKSQVYHFHDPELIFVGIGLKIAGKKVIFDMHELIYHQIADKKWIGIAFVRKFIAFLYKVIEKLCVRIFDKIILAEDGYLDYFKENYPKRMHKFVFVRNYPMISMINNNQLIENKSDKTVLVYAGGLTRIRGIKEVCEAVKKINQPVELKLMGIWESDAYKNECLSNNEKVSYLGVLPLEEVYPILQNSDIGISNLYPVKNYLTSLPVKAFEYLACGLPIIMSNFPYWKQMFADYALFVEPTNIDNLVETINYAIDNKSKMKEMGIKGKIDVPKLYCWETEKEKLISIYNELSQQ